MRKKSPRGSRTFIARFEGLEDRRLLTNTPFTINSVSQVANDFVSSTQNPGADGFEDVKIAVSNLLAGQEIASADVVGTLTNGNQLQWVSGENSDGFLNAEVVRVTNRSSQSPYFPYFQDNSFTTADLYISSPPSGETLSSLSITLNDSSGNTQTANDSSDSAFSSLSATTSVTGETVPSSLPAAGGSAQFDGQYATAGTSPTHSAGDAHVSLLTLPSGYSFSSLVDVYPQ